MIHFTLSCDKDHAFEAWFRNNEDFAAQKKRGLIACPQCGSAEVEKALMAPALATGGRRETMALAMNDEQRRALTQLKQLSEKLKQNADYVGPKFAEEARKIHFGETEARGIYGEASGEEASALAEDGIDFMPLPSFPDESN